MYVKTDKTKGRMFKTRFFFFWQKLNIVYYSFSVPIFLKSNVNINGFVESVENTVAH